MKKRSTLSLLALLFCTAAVQGETLAEKLSSGDLKAVENSVTIKPAEETAEAQKIRKLTDTPDRPIDGITVKVMDVNLSKKSSVSVEYAPALKQGDVIDNKEKTSVNYNLKF